MAPFVYETVGAFSEGLARMSRDGKWGYLDKNGKEAVAARYEAAPPLLVPAHHRVPAAERVHIFIPRRDHHGPALVDEPVLPAPAHRRKPFRRWSTSAG